VLGDHPDYFATISDGHGRFAVTIPGLTGMQELYVAPESEVEGGVEVRIDQDFDASTPPLAAEHFSLSGKEQEVATRMAIQMQIAEAFRIDKSNKTSEESLEPVPFYGYSVHTTKMDDYITLPTLEEVFINMVPDVFVQKRKNRTALKIVSENRTTGMYDPLVLIDYIPVFDIETLVATSPKKILRIDVIKNVYIKGDMNYGGIISIISRKGDMAGIDLPSDSYFFDYQALKKGDPAAERQAVPGDRIPDTRNTLLWIPNLVLEKQTTSSVTFKAPEITGEYVVLVRGMVGSREVQTAFARFIVK